MRRREFITLLGGAAAWPLTARAQQGERVRRIGVLMSFLDNDLEAQAYVAAFHQGLQKLGWVEGRNIHTDSRWARGEDTETLQKLARELVGLDPHVILSSSTPLRPLCRRRAAFPSFSRLLSIRSAAALSETLTTREATLPALPSMSRQWPANGWNCSRR